jgi:RNA polymerase sigma-70 factor (ECF subfamily)
MLPRSFVDTTSQTLLERLRQAADEVDWERFLNHYSPLRVHWARRLGLAGPDVEDPVREVFALLVRKLRDFHYQRDRRFRAWLWTVTLNKHRERRRRGALAVQPATTSMLDDLPGPEQVLEPDEAEYRQYMVPKALQLSEADVQPSTWRAFREYVMAGHPAADVAAELQLSLDGVYAAKSRVLRRLREDLEGLLD